MDSVTFEWPFKDVIVDGHHVGVFYKILDYEKDIKANVSIDKHNNDFLGTSYYAIKD